MTRLVHIVLIMLLSFASVGFAPAPVSAQQELSEAEQQKLLDTIDKGKAAYDRGEFQTSLELFRKAYDIYQHPDIVYRIALCHERLGEDAEAVKFYRQFLAEAPDAPERARVEKTIDVIESRISKSEIRVTTSPKGASVYVDDEANGVAGYTPTALAVKPGNYKLIVKKSGYETISELVTVDPGQSVQMRYQLNEVGTQTTAPPRTDTRKKSGSTPPSVKFLTLASIGVAAGITSIVFFGIHSDRSAKFEEVDALPPQEVPRNRHEQLKLQRNTALAVAVSSAAVSAFAIIWAYGTYVADRSAARQARIGLDWQQGTPMVTYGFSF